MLIVDPFKALVHMLQLASKAGSALSGVSCCGFEIDDDPVYLKPFWPLQKSEIVPQRSEF